MSFIAIADRDQEHVLHEPQSFIRKYVWSQDHKVIAIQYAAVAISIGVLAVVMSMMMRLQLGFPDTFSLIEPERYYQFITMHGMIMVIYLLTALFLGGFGNLLIPLMCGARDMVFPYMNMLSFWVYLLAVLVLLAGLFAPGGPTGAGWTLYPPQSVLPGTPGATWGVILMLVSLAIFIVAFTMGGLNYVTTVLQARCSGMTLMRMPLSVWGIFTASVLGLLAFPALFVSAIMMLLDNVVGTSFFMPAIVSLGEQTNYSGGSPLLFQHLFWFFGHPEVYIVALPAFGVVSDLLSTHARKNIFGYRMMVWAILAIGCLSFVVWAHHMYISGMNPYFGFFFATTTLIIAVPTAIKVYNWILTIWRGDVHLTTPMLFAIGFIFTFINGGLTGLFLGNVTVDVPLSGTYFVVAHFHMVMGVSPVLVVFGAIYHWYPKVTGRMLNETLGKAHFWITFLGAYAIFLPMHYLGIMGVPRRYYAYPESIDFIPASAAELNQWISVAAMIVAAAQLLFLFNVFWSLRHGAPSGPNPWRATTLEWQTPDTPPKHGNWGKQLPVVHRWAYDYNVPGAAEDFIPQNAPPMEDAPKGRDHGVKA
ncbi:MAG TPA: cbb3-type cytochrome c oxidase subunit I [Steroidobacter sp.]|jgi:cytochrome c oxidase subunit 1|nr:cbb3-type cytochrome c oxidase subunit I [Steroidobacteraceae bacterium]HLS82693.1 cbb3-type cytochrome c oxidase subunit I [Steroidobacter sp.]